MALFRSKCEADRQRYVAEQTLQNREARGNRRESTHRDFRRLFECEPDGRDGEVDNIFYVDQLQVSLSVVRWVSGREGAPQVYRGRVEIKGECPECGEWCWSKPVEVITGRLEQIGILLARPFEPDPREHDCGAAAAAPNVYKQRLEAIAEAIGDQLLEMEYIAER